MEIKALKSLENINLSQFKSIKGSIFRHILCTLAYDLRVDEISINGKKVDLLTLISILGHKVGTVYYKEVEGQLVIILVSERINKILVV